MQITIRLPAETAAQLERIAIAERRRPREQAEWLVMRALAAQSVEPQRQDE